MTNTLAFGAALAVGGTIAFFTGWEPSELVVAQQIASMRDDALKKADAEALLALSVPGSPAREADEKLARYIRDHNVNAQGITTVVTAVDRVHVGKEVLWRVESIQSGVSGPEAGEGKAVHSCALWQFDAATKQMYRTFPCESGKETPRPQ
ncbi:hypothetical protein J2S49_000264 [Arcanobacterium wilhelmae]|uniref:Uncharacterized protein n=1 Tax=Arcanobacterium wilhelmae TaxID=1803177 RepID=A0ABT9N918_9ACTO|nr:hypothetical protein [Arcanobacterium wilhelmae]MDP9800188.1 hypothetical protein [Arcanobacterium wilhelmae]WFN89629.1 hypothetical protein P8A24_05315 [Arcanobacterium wilhelmae]